VSAVALLVAVAALLGAAAARDLSFDLPRGVRRLSASGRWGAERRPGSASLAPRLIGSASGLILGWLAMPVAPGRTALLVAAGMPIAGFLAPQALLEHRARLRRRRLIAALPDALDLLAVSSVSGRSPAAGLAELARSGRGPLAEELAVTVAETACGMPLSEALGSLRARAPGSEVARLCAAIERSRLLGSPLADQLRRQATSLRRDQRRTVEERAARAAPKIQLVVALVLVPSVLLMIGAALIANADLLLAGF
jgi:tight adherence protein C